MARCGCTQGCSCLVEGSVTDSTTTTVTGNGAPGTPYVVAVESNCCAYGFNGIGDGDAASGANADADAIAPNNSLPGYLYPTATGIDELPPGMWMVSGYVEVTFDAPATGSVDVSYVSPDGGVVQGHGLANGESPIEVPFSGVVLQTVNWTPQVNVSNDTDENCSFVVHYNAFGSSCLCGTSVTVSGE